MGMDAGPGKDEIKAIAEGSTTANWSSAERLLIGATDELHGDAFVGDTTYAELEKHFSENQILDMVFTVGPYNMVSMALNTAGVQLDDGIPEYKSFLGK